MWLDGVAGRSGGSKPRSLAGRDWGKANAQADDDSRGDGRGQKTALGAG